MKKNLLNRFIFVFLSCLVCSYPVFAFVGNNTGLAAKTVRFKNPENPVKEQECLVCHTTVQKLHARGSHGKVNCASCHDVPKDHSISPSPNNRPVTHTDHATCAQCHPDQLKDMMDMKLLADTPSDS